MVSGASFVSLQAPTTVPSSSVVLRRHGPRRAAWATILVRLKGEDRLRAYSSKLWAGSEIDAKGRSLNAVMRL